MERLEWHQFQCDLQVAVSVADRLRVESEQALGLLQESHRAVEEQLAQALSRQQEKDRELESLRAEHREVCLKLSEVTLQRQQEQAELDSLRSQVKDGTGCDQQAERQHSEEELQEVLENKPKKAEIEAEGKNVEEQKDENETSQEAVAHNPEEANGSESSQLTGKGVAEGYLRSLAALEKKKEKPKDPRRIVMLSERSWWVHIMTLNTVNLTDREQYYQTWKKCLLGVSLVFRSQLIPPLRLGPQKTQAQHCRYARYNSCWTNIKMFIKLSWLYGWMSLNFFRKKSHQNTEGWTACYSGRTAGPAFTQVSLKRWYVTFLH